jgi:prophage regulatory protein
MRILRRPKVEEKTGYSRSAIYQRMACGTFPKPVKLGPKAVGWIESEIDSFIAEQIRRRDEQAA